MLSYAPEDGESIIRFLLAESLQGVVHQELLPTLDGRQRVACEVMTITTGAKNIIRQKGGFHLRNVIATGKKFGMIPMSDSIKELLEQKLIALDTAKRIMTNYGG